MYVPVLGISGILAYGYYSCLDEAPLTKRKRLIATSPRFERQLGDEEYAKLLKQFKSKILPPEHRACITVRRVGSRIAEAGKKFSEEHLPPNSISSAPYTYTVVRSDMANAFVLPNNHVFVLTGLFKYARDEDELAAVMGHEMAHNLARHVGEKVSNSFIISIIARLSLIFDPSGFLYMVFLPASALLHDLPHSRDAEVEADHIGIHLAAEACYDPRAASRVFSAMKESANCNRTSKMKRKDPPEFISTHPSYDSRLSNFEKWMPDALAKFDADGGLKCQRIRGEMKLARKRAAELAARRERMELGMSRPQHYDPFRDEQPQFKW